MDIAFVDEFNKVKYANHGEGTPVNDETIAAFCGRYANAAKSWGESRRPFPSPANHRSLPTLMVIYKDTFIRLSNGRQRILDEVAAFNSLCPV